MTTNNVHAVDDATAAFTRRAWRIVVVLLIVLALLWLLGYGPERAGCCTGAPPVAAALQPAPVVAPAPAPAPAPATAPAPAPALPVVDCVALVNGLDVPFASGSANLTEGGRAALDGVLGCLAKGNFEVGGHTDSSGNAQGNQRLSLARAEAARAYLIKKGVGAEQLVARAYGDTRPLASNATEAGRAQNRRIAFSAH